MEEQGFHNDDNNLFYKDIVKWAYNANDVLDDKNVMTTDSQELYLYFPLEQ